MSSATIFDVARLAGVSKTTASDALRGHGRVAESTRASVESAAERLGYSINRSARSLRTSTTGAVGLYIPKIVVRSEYYLSFVYGVTTRAAQAEYDVTLIMSGQSPTRRNHPNVDGLILCDPVSSDPVAQALLTLGRPVVTCERFDSDPAPAGVVWSDHAACLEELLDHLARSGAKHPALLASTTVSDWSMSIGDRYRKWCATRSILPVTTSAAFGTDVTGLQATVTQLLRENPSVDALICAADGVAAAVAPAIRGRGRTIGRDFLLASCVDSSSMQVSDPPITAIDTKGGDVGDACARLLFDLLSGREPAGTVREVPLDLHLRASTGGTH